MSGLKLISLKTLEERESVLAMSSCLEKNYNISTKRFAYEPMDAAYFPYFFQMKRKVGLSLYKYSAANTLLSHIESYCVGSTMRIHDTNRPRLNKKRIETDLGMQNRTLNKAIKDLKELRLLGGDFSSGTAYEGPNIYLTYDIDHFYTNECPLETLGLYNYYERTMMDEGSTIVSQEEYTYDIMPKLQKQKPEIIEPIKPTKPGEVYNLSDYKAQNIVNKSPKIVNKSDISVDNLLISINSDTQMHPSNYTDAPLQLSKCTPLTIDNKYKLIKHINIVIGQAKSVNNFSDSQVELNPKTKYKFDFDKFINYSVVLSDNALQRKIIYSKYLNNLPMDKFKFSPGVDELASASKFISRCSDNSIKNMDYLESRIDTFSLYTKILILQAMAIIERVTLFGEDNKYSCNCYRTLEALIRSATVPSLEELEAGFGLVDCLSAKELRQRPTMLSDMLSADMCDKIFYIA